MYLEAHAEREERIQQTMRAHAYLVSGMVWAFASPEAKSALPSFEQFVFAGKQKQKPADPAAATASSVAAWDAYLSRVGGRPA